MRKCWPTLLFFFGLSTLSIAADPKYPVSEIPEELKKGMYAVVRDSKTEIKISSKSKVVWREYKAITIFNVKGNDSGQEAVYYERGIKINYFKGTVYDRDGNVIKRLKGSDIIDQSAVSGYSLFEDGRYKIADLRQGKYPYTVEFEYETESMYSLGIPAFYLYRDDEISIQKQTFEIQFPETNEPKYKLYKLAEPDRTISDGVGKISWEFLNFTPPKHERFSPDRYEVIPNVQFLSNEFEYGGYKGKMDSWENYGYWQASLNKGRDYLPEETVKNIKNLTSNAKTIEEKARIVYEHLQSKTRYVSIQLGIGGLQPFPASVVDQLGYGDCKALSNYVVSLLSKVGVKAYYTEIRAGKGESDIDINIPGAYQTNHVIVAIPNEEDTIWLECTSQTNPFGYLGSFTGDRYALMITEEGGKIVRTPNYPQDINIQSRTAEVVVTNTGDAKATVKTRYAGLQYENGNLNFVLNNNYDDQKKWVTNNTDIPTFDVVGFSFVDHKEKIPYADVSLELSLRKLASVSGKRLFLTPNLMNRSTYVPEKTEKRVNDIVFRMGYIDYDTIKYQIPDDIYVEHLPNPIEIKSQFGAYEASFSIDQGSVVYIRKMKRNKGRFPAESYKELTDFYKSINKADNTKLVFLTKT